MQVGSEFLPANQDGSLELLLDCVDDFLDARTDLISGGVAGPDSLQIYYVAETPLEYRDGENFLTSLRFSVVTTRRARGYPRREQHMTVEYCDRAGVILYGNGYLVERHAGRLAMYTHTIGLPDTWLKQVQDAKLNADITWSPGTEYDLAALSEAFLLAQTKAVALPRA